MLFLFGFFCGMAFLTICLIISITIENIKDFPILNSMPDLSSDLSSNLSKNIESKSLWTTTINYYKPKKSLYKRRRGKRYI